MSKQKRSLEIAGNKFSIHSSCSDQKEQLTNLINCAGGSVVEALETADYLIFRQGKHRGGLGNVLQKYSQLSAIEIDDLYDDASEKAASPSNEGEQTEVIDTSYLEAPSSPLSIRSNSIGALSSSEVTTPTSESPSSEDTVGARPIGALPSSIVTGAHSTSFSASPPNADAMSKALFGLKMYIDSTIRSFTQSQFIPITQSQTRFDQIDKKLEDLQASVNIVTVKVDKALSLLAFLGATFKAQGEKLLE